MSQVQRGVKANSEKVDKILNWPIPTTTSEVCEFLGIVRYLSEFSPNLADHTTIFMPLMIWKDAQWSFPSWSTENQAAFDAIKCLVVSKDSCLTVIDHQNPGDNK